MPIRSPHPSDAAVALAITILCGCVLAGIAVSFWVSR